MGNIILQMRGVSKCFPGVKALQAVNLELREGEVHALLGENGAGKSTLMKCLAGIYQIDEGQIYFMDREVRIHTVQDSIALGISFIHQELALADQLTVAENIFMGREPQKKMGFIDRRAMYAKSQELLQSIDGQFSAYARAGSLSTAQKQMVEIAKALSVNAKIIVMDEPTAALTQREVEKLFQLIESLKAHGISIVYISHRMEEIFRVADRITVLRDGMRIQTLGSGDTTEQELIRMMVGHELDKYYTRTRHAIGGTVLEVKGLTSTNNRVRDASFVLHKGEILGFAGLVGAGRTELMQMLFGIRKVVSGEILLDGKPISIARTRDAMKHGIGLVPEDRKMQGLVMRNTVRFNITIGVLRQFISFIRVNRHKEEQISNEYVKALSIKISSPMQQVINLSGGNQQKVVLSKWLAISPDILIMDEPTRGIDVGAKAEIYALMDELANRGISIIMISSEMPELINMCDRMYVMYGGEIQSCLKKEEISQEKILRYALGVEKNG